MATIHGINEQAVRKLAGTVVIYNFNGRARARAWPRGRKTKPGEAETLNRKRFGEVQTMISKITWGSRVQWREFVYQRHQMWFDYVKRNLISAHADNAVLPLVFYWRSRLRVDPTSDKREIQIQFAKETAPAPFEVVIRYKPIEPTSKPVDWELVEKRFPKYGGLQEVWNPDLGGFLASTPVLVDPAEGVVRWRYQSPLNSVRWCIVSPNQSNFSKIQTPVFLPTIIA